MSKGSLHKRLVLLNVKLNESISDCIKTDTGNFSASSRLTRSLREAEKELRALRGKVRARRKQIKAEFEQTHQHRRGKNFKGSKHSFKKRKL